MEMEYFGFGIGLDVARYGDGVEREEEGKGE